MAGQDKETVTCHRIVPLHLQSLGTATFTYLTLSFSFDEAHAVSLSPDWSRWTPEVRGRLSTKAGGAGGRGDGLTFLRPLSRFVYRTLSFAFLPLVKGRRAKTPQIERGGKRGGLFYLSSGPGGVFVKVFRLVREELRWGSVWLAGCSVGVLS